MAKRVSSQEYISFECPGCKKTHTLPTGGAHGWKFNGNYELPTLSPSILARTPQGDKPAIVCHSFVTDGKIKFLDDCTHELRNQTVDLFEI